MGQITINLLPPSIANNQKLSGKRVLAIKISSGIILLMVVVTVGILVYRVSQISRIRAANLGVETTQAEVAALSEEEGLINILRNRIGLIGGIIQTDSEQTQAFNLIISLKPQDIKIVNLSLNKAKTISLGGEATNPQSLQEFFDNLTNQEKNQGKVSKAQIQSLGRGTSDIYKFDLVITLK